MSIAILRELTYKELQGWFRHRMELKGWNKGTIDTYYSDAFYVWRKESPEVFWKLIESKNFKAEAEEKIQILLLKYSSGNVKDNKQDYFRALNIFREFCIFDNFESKRR